MNDFDTKNAILVWMITNTRIQGMLKYLADFDLTALDRDIGLWRLTLYFQRLDYRWGMHDTFLASEIDGVEFTTSFWSRLRHEYDLELRGAARHE